MRNTEDRWITLIELMHRPDEVAPVTGAVCRSCAASAEEALHRWRYAPESKSDRPPTWFRHDGAMYCRDCAGMLEE